MSDLNRSALRALAQAANYGTYGAIEFKEKITRDDVIGLIDALEAAEAERERLRAVAARIEGERLAAMSALFRNDLAHGEESVRLTRDLAIVTTARNALADIADDLNSDNGDDEELDRRRAEIAALRCLERTEGDAPQ